MALTCPLSHQLWVAVVREPAPQPAYSSSRSWWWQRHTFLFLLQRQGTPLTSVKTPGGTHPNAPSAWVGAPTRSWVQGCCSPLVPSDLLLTKPSTKTLAHRELTPQRAPGGFRGKEGAFASCPLLRVYSLLAVWLREVWEVHTPQWQQDSRLASGPHHMQNRSGAVTHTGNMENSCGQHEYPSASCSHEGPEEGATSRCQGSETTCNPALLEQAGDVGNQHDPLGALSKGSPLTVRTAPGSLSWT